MIQTRARLYIVLFTATAAATAACSGDDGGGSDGLADLLEKVPASVAAEAGDSGIAVTLADLETAADEAGVERPSDPSDAKAVTEYVTAITGEPPPDDDSDVAFALAPNPADPGEVYDEVGWSMANVSWLATYSVPPNTFTAYGGDFEEDELTGAMGEPDGDIWKLGPDDGEIDPSDVTAARPNGDPLRLALDGDELITSSTTPLVEDALAGDDDTLGDNEQLAALAEAMDDEDVYSAMLVSERDFTFDPGAMQLTAELADEVEQFVVPETFTGIGFGVAGGDDPAGVLAYTHDSDDAAAANADALRQILEEGASISSGSPWSDTFGVDEIDTDGSTLIARLTPAGDARPDAVYNLLFTLDGLVWHQ